MSPATLLWVLPIVTCLLTPKAVSDSGSSATDYNDDPNSQPGQEPSSGMKPSSVTFHYVMSKVVSFVNDLSHYNKHVLPHKANLSATNPTNVEALSVTIWANILYLGDITPQMDFTVDMFLSQQWIDPRLDDLLPESLDSIVIDGELIDSFWLPLTIVRNSKKTRVHDEPSTNRVLRLYQNGTVNYKIRIETTCWCTLNLKRYPFDNQTCQVIFEQFGHHRNDIKYDKLKYQTRPLFAPQCTYPSKFRLLFNNTSYESACLKYDELDQFSIFKIEFRFIREIGPIIIQSHIPACLVVVISWLGFYINRNSRFSLGVVLVMALSALTFSSVSRADNVGSISGEDIYTFVCFVFVFLSLVEYGLVHFLGNRSRNMKVRNRMKFQKNTAALPYKEGRRRRRSPLERKVISTTEYTNINMQDLSSDVSSDDENSTTFSSLDASYAAQSTDSDSSSQSVRRRQPNADTRTTRRIDYVSRCVLPVLFIAFNMIYWAYFMTRYRAVQGGS